MRVSGEKLTKEYIRRGENTNVFAAVHEADIELMDGTLTVISGRSGSGKSTLLNMLAGILTPSSGRVCYTDSAARHGCSVSYGGDVSAEDAHLSEKVNADGEEIHETGAKDVYKMDDKERSAFRNTNIGYIPQGSSAISSLTVRENILLPTSFGTGIDECEDRAGELMERLGISHISDVRPRELSGGELRRMAIARALVMSPPVLFADEPTGDLDDENTQAVFEILRSQADSGTTVLVVTHEDMARNYADVCFNMSAGSISLINI